MTIHSRSTYELAIDCDDHVRGAGVRTTMAVGDMVAINVMFARDESGHVVIASDGHPIVAQRRIDMSFFNRYCTTMQVCSMFCS